MNLKMTTRLRMQSLALFQRDAGDVDSGVGGNFLQSPAGEIFRQAVEEAHERERLENDPKRAEFARRNEEARTARLANEKATRDARIAADKERERQNFLALDAKNKSAYRPHYLAAGGDPTKFDALWESELRAEYAKELALRNATNPQHRVGAEF
jgi:hypothetical protein